MKKNTKLALIIGVISIIVILVGLVGSVTLNNQPQTNEVPIPSVSEGKSFILKLDDSISASTP